MFALFDFWDLFQSGFLTIFLGAEWGKAVFNMVCGVALLLFKNQSPNTTFSVIPTFRESFNH